MERTFAKRYHSVSWLLGDPRTATMHCKRDSIHLWHSSKFSCCMGPLNEASKLSERKRYTSTKNKTEKSYLSLSWLSASHLQYPSSSLQSGICSSVPLNFQSCSISVPSELLPKPWQDTAGTWGLSSWKQLDYRIFKFLQLGPLSHKNCIRIDSRNLVTSLNKIHIILKSN